MATKQESERHDQATKSPGIEKSNHSEKKRGGLISDLRGVRTEMAKVVWPTRRQLAKDTVAVFVVCAFFALIFWGMDTGFLAILRGILGVSLT